MTKIERVVPHFYEYPLRTPISDARNTITHRSCVLVEVRTDDGLVGWGEAASFAGCGRLVCEVVEFFSSRIQGSSALLPAALFDQQLAATQHFGRRGLVVNALSGIDIALWDLLGKRAGMPLHQILGATKDSIKGYFNSGYYTEDHRDALIRSVEGAVEAGCGAIKIKIGRHGIADDVWRIKTAKEILKGRDLMVDVNACLQRRDLRVLDEICCEHNVRWIEEPVPLDCIESLVELRSRTKTPIAGYELEMTTGGWHPLISQRAVDIVQPDTIWSGGITEVRRVATLAASQALEFVPHNFASIIALAANCHVAAAAPTGGWLELDSNENPFLWPLQQEQNFRLNDGVLALPSTPGLGVTPNLESLAQWRSNR